MLPSGAAHLKERSGRLPRNPDKSVPANVLFNLATEGTESTEEKMDWAYAPAIRS